MLARVEPTSLPHEDRPKEMICFNLVRGIRTREVLVNVAEPLNSGSPKLGNLGARRYSAGHRSSVIGIIGL